MLDMEPLIDEMTLDHEMQFHEVIGVILAHLEAHHPDSKEEYEDGSVVELSYRPTKRN
jgi:hypothetical protein